MKSYFHIAMIAFLSAGLCVAAAAAPNNDANPSLAAPASASAAGSNLLSSHLNAAVDAFAQRDRDTTAAELRAAAEVLETEGRTAPADLGQDLSASALDLRQLAADIEPGTVKVGDRIEAAVGRAYWAGARANYEKALRAWSDRNFALTSQAARFAADDLEQGVTRSGRTPNADTREDVSEVRTWADKIVLQPIPRRANNNRLLTDMGREIDRFGQAMGLKTAVAPTTGNKSRIACLWAPGETATPAGKVGTSPPVPANGVPLNALTLACTVP